MKLHKEAFWIILAVVAVPMYFAWRETLEVKDGIVSAYQTTWWYKRANVKSIESSHIREVCTRSRGCGGSHAISIEVTDDRGRLFWVQQYQGFDKVGRSCRDADALKYAIKTGSAFSATNCKSAMWALLVIIISLFMWVYKRAWRLERERQVTPYGDSPRLSR